MAQVIGIFILEFGVLLHRQAALLSGMEQVLMGNVILVY